MSKRSKFDDAGGVLEQAHVPLEGLTRYRVRLSAETPLAHPELEVEAANETEAREKFMAANGISASACPWEVTRL